MTQDVLAWYNSLYSELSVPQGCEYRIPDPEPPPSEEIISDLVELGLEITQDIATQALIIGLTGIPSNAVNLVLNGLRNDVKKALQGN